MFGKRQDIANLLDFLLEELHFATLSVHKHHIFWLTILNQLHDAFGVGMSWEGHVLERKQNYY